MAIIDDISTLKTKEGTLTNNKVSNFAYDDDAFTNDNANGVSTYNYNNHNNIPVSDPSVIKVNPTIVAKGFRSQFSTLPRMLVNHFFGRISYNLNKTVDVLNGLLSSLYSYIGQPNGLATLDNTGRLPYTQLPLSAVEYKGAWDADTNTPTLASGNGTFGDEYIVSVQGTQNIGEGSITYRVGDRVIYNGSIWQRIPASSVRTVNTKTPDANGNVAVNAIDITTPDVYGYDRRTAGKTWVRAGDTNGKPFYDSLFANGIWIAVGGGGVWKSTDNGVTWSQVYTASVTKVHYANGVWVVGGADGLFYSYNTSTWNTAVINNGTANNITDIRNSGSLWVACSSYTANSMFWSLDGKNWEVGTATNNTGFNCVCYADSTWLAGSKSNGGIWLSSDGKTWTKVNSFTTSTINYIYYAEGLFIACTGGEGLLWSGDGTVWIQCTGAITTYSFLCVLYADGKWVAGSTQHDLYYSTDGKFWSICNTGGSGYSFNSLGYANGLWLAGGSNLYTSTNAITWERALSGNVNTVFRDLCYANGIWVASGSYNTTSSSDGIRISIGESTNNVNKILDWLIYAVDNLLA